MKRQFRLAAGFLAISLMLASKGDDVPWIEITTNETARVSASAETGVADAIDSGPALGVVTHLVMFDSRCGNCVTSDGVSIRTDPIRGICIIFR